MSQGAEKPWARLRTTIAAVLVLGCTAADSATENDPDCCTFEDVTYRNGDIILAAELLMPKVPASPFPAAVILQGSGGGFGTTRKNGWPMEMAELVAESGVAVLLTDKRGSGLSGGDWRTASFEDLAGDALAGVRYLRGRDDIDGTRVGLIGMSQGGHVAPYAANIGTDIAFVIDVSGSLIPMRETLYHELHQTYRQLGHEDSAIDDLQEMTRMSFLYLDTGKYFDRYLEVRRRIGAKYGELYVETWPADPEDTYWTFWGQIKDYDPIPHWQQIIKGKRIPSFVAYGELDELDNAEVVRSQVRMARHLADPLLLFRVYAETGHDIGSPNREEGTWSYHEEFQRDLRVWLDKLIRPAPALRDRVPGTD